MAKQTKKKNDDPKPKEEFPMVTAKDPEVIEIPEESKAIELTIDQLRETSTFADAHGLMPKQFPMEHHIFIEKLLGMITDTGAKAEIGQILASVKGIQRISEAEAKSKNLNQKEARNTTVRVLIGRIDIGDEFTKPLWNLAIGFMYNEKGIEVCIGTNISICSNFTIYGEARHLRNYGRDAMELNKIFDTIEDWIKNFEGIEGVNSALLQRMADMKIIWNEGVKLFIGECVVAAVRRLYHKGDPFPLTVTLINRMTSYLIDLESKLLNDGISPSLYTLYNAGTYVLTHNTDLEGKFGSIREFTTWFEEHWLKPTESEEGKVKRVFWKMELVDDDLASSPGPEHTKGIDSEVSPGSDEDTKENDS